MNELHRTLRIERAGNENFVHELLALQWRHVGHALAMRDTDAIQIWILLQHLRDAFLQIAARKLGRVTRHVIVRIEILRGDVVRLRKFLADEDAPENDVSVEAAFLRHPENAAIQLLPLSE